MIDQDPMEQKLTEVVLEFCLFHEMDPYETLPNGKLRYECDELRKEAIRQMAWYSAITKSIRSSK